MTTEAHQVHIENLYSKISDLAKNNEKRHDDLAKDCEEQHRIGLEAIQRIHTRIDEFARIVVQMSEMNKDLQATVAHQRVLESKNEMIATKQAALDASMSEHRSTIKAVHRIAWGLAGFLGIAIGTALWQLISVVPK